MRFPMFRGAIAACALVAASGVAQAATLNGNYNVTFSVVGGGQVSYCANLVSQGAVGPYRDVGTAALFVGGSQVASGTYVVYQHTLAVVVGSTGTYLSVSGQFTRTSQFNTAVIEFTNGGAILGTATFTAVRQGQKCTA